VAADRTDDLRAAGTRLTDGGGGKPSEKDVSGHHGIINRPVDADKLPRTSGRSKSQQLRGQDDPYSRVSITPHGRSNADYLHYAVTGEFPAAVVPDRLISSKQRSSRSQPPDAAAEPASVPTAPRHSGRPKGSGLLIPGVQYAVTEYRRIRTQLGHAPDAGEFRGLFQPPAQRVSSRYDSEPRSGVPIASETGKGISAPTLNRFLVRVDLTWERFAKLARKRD